MRLAVKQYFSLIIFAGCFALAFDVSAVENFKLEEGESLPRSELSKAHHAHIEKVLSSDDFARKKTVKRWRVKDITDEETRDEAYPEWVIDTVEAMEGGGGFISSLASVIEVFLWLLVIGLILFVVLKYREQIGGFLSELGRDEPDAELPTTMFGLDVQKSSMPKDVVETARQHWIDGERRQGIALLLQASLIALLHDHGCRFFDSDTESECCERIEQQASKSLSSYMWKLVGAWQQIAYAHREPSDTQFDGLCREWREVF